MKLITINLSKFAGLSVLFFSLVTANLSVAEDKSEHEGMKHKHMQHGEMKHGEMKHHNGHHKGMKHEGKQDDVNDSKEKSHDAPGHQMAEDNRKLVKMPEMMQEHMLANMRDHLMALNEILALMGDEKLDKAADVAENRLGMSSMDDHGAHHMGQLMPEGMRKAGSSMHRAASRFALKAQEGEPLPAYKALQEVTAGCVACHAGYKIR